MRQWRIVGKNGVETVRKARTAGEAAAGMKSHLEKMNHNVPNPGVTSPRTTMYSTEGYHVTQVKPEAK